MLTTEAKTTAPRKVELIELRDFLTELCAFTGALEIMRDHQENDPRRLPAMEKLADEVCRRIGNLRSAFDAYTGEAS